MRIQYKGEIFPTVYDLVESVQPFIDSWTDEDLERFLVNALLPVDSRSMNEILEGGNK
jgi:hypothetical protein